MAGCSSSSTGVVTPGSYTTVGSSSAPRRRRWASLWKTSASRRPSAPAVEPPASSWPIACLIESVSVPGVELSEHQHTLSLFTTYPRPLRDDFLENQWRAIAEVQQMGGLTVLAHPGRYWELEDGQVPKPVIERYVTFFKTYPALIGHEVVNQTDRYPHDRALWDALLTRLMPDRPVWGMANDDSHARPHVGLNRTQLLLTSLDRESVEKALRNGRFYFTTRATRDEENRDRETTPRIEKIKVNEKGTRITVKATSAGEPVEAKRYHWISAHGQRVGMGATLDLTEAAGINAYVRLQIEGEGGTTFTQPFGIKQKEE